MNFLGILGDSPLNSQFLKGKILLMPEHPSKYVRFEIGEKGKILGVEIVEHIPSQKTKG